MVATEDTDAGCQTGIHLRQVLLPTVSDVPRIGLRMDQRILCRILEEEIPGHNLGK